MTAPTAVRTGLGVNGETIILGAYCHTCREEAMPLTDGTCGWCETQLGATLTAHRTEPRMGIPTCITEPVLHHARELYTTGLSFRQVAEKVWPQTTYKTEKSCAQAIYSLFRSRGWPARSQSAVTAARNYKHGRKAGSVGENGPEVASYRRWLKQQRDAYRPACAAVKTGKTGGKGKPCSNRAMAGSDYCYAHNPDLAAERDSHTARMRALSPLKNAHTVTLDRSLTLLARDVAA